MTVEDRAMLLEVLLERSGREPVMTEQELGDWLSGRGVEASPETLRDWRTKRLGPRAVKAGRQWLYPLTAILDWLATDCATSPETPKTAAEAATPATAATEPRPEPAAVSADSDRRWCAPRRDRDDGLRPELPPEAPLSWHRRLARHERSRRIEPLSQSASKPERGRRSKQSPKRKGG